MDNKEIKGIINRAIEDLKLKHYIFESPKIDFMTSIRLGIMYVELYVNGKCFVEVSEELPDGTFDDVEIEKRLLIGFITELMFEGLKIKCNE